MTVNEAARDSIKSDCMDVDDVLPAAVAAPSSNKQQLSIQESIEGEDYQQLIKIYYRRLFPFKKFIRWLSYGGTISHREFSFTLREQGQEIYMRFASYENQDEFMTDLLKKNPEKIDIGAVYTGRPKMKNSLRPGSFKPVERELVFDIDMTDYDEVRTCCKGADICTLCWKFITIAMKILNSALVEDFGFKHILWVYSGRRGIHAWVCDERARNLSEDSRKAIVSYLEIIRGGEQKTKKVTFYNGLKHPSLKRACSVVDQYFQQVVLNEQKLLSHPEKEAQVLDMISNTSFRETIQSQWKSSMDSSRKWSVVEQAAENFKNGETALQEIKFQCLYPRLDAQVSMHLNHLLKSPFCIHPKTGRVCVPVTMQDVETFNPLSVPTMAQLIMEIDKFDMENPGFTDTVTGKPIPDWKKTSLKPYMSAFENFVVDLEESSRQKLVQKRIQDEMQLNF